VKLENKNTCRWPIVLVISVPKSFVNGQLVQLSVEDVVTCFWDTVYKLISLIFVHRLEASLLKRGFQL